ncbi:MAG: Fic family protein [Cyclobacteriaceae bacterium]|jgi:Fic family protein
MWIYNYKNWPSFTWDQDELVAELTQIRHQQGKLLGQMGQLDFDAKSKASLQIASENVLKSSLIEGEQLPKDEVRSSVARRLGLNVGGLTASSREVDGVVEVMLDATLNYNDRLTQDRLFGWHSSLFPSGRSGMYSIVTGKYRNNTQEDPMQVVSGPMGKKRVHFQAPDSSSLENEMRMFLMWFNGKSKIDYVLKAAIAHFWFITLHPFEDGNGRMARAIADLLLAKSDDTTFRFYSMSARIEKEKEEYYKQLEYAQKGNLDITEWLHWFLQCLLRSFEDSKLILDDVLFKARFWNNRHLLGVNPRQQKMLEKLLDDFQGKLTTSKWAKMTKTSQDTAGRDINDLIKRGVLKKDKSGGRSTSYLLVR